MTSPAEMGELARRRRGRCSDGPPGRRLFIGGCPRSGTTALATFLNGDERFIVGQERFRRIIKVARAVALLRAGVLQPHAARDLLGDAVARETVFPGNPEDYCVLRERWQGGAVEVLGDKAPYYHRFLPQLADAFPDSVFVILVRDLHEVAGSYLRRATNPEDHWPLENDHRLAVQDWNEALRNTRAFAESEEGSRLLVLDYDRFYAGAPGQLERLYRFIGLALEPVWRRGTRPSWTRDDGDGAR